MQVLIADDHAIFREGLIMLLGSHFPNIQWHQASSWYETWKMLECSPVSLALLDLNMPSQNPWPGELRKLGRKFSNIDLCVVSATTDPEVIQSVFTLGVKGYIPKLVDTAELLKAFSHVMAGNTYLPPELWTAPQPQLHRHSLLSRRQQNIMQLVSEGHNNKQISLKLELAESTVKRHIYNIFQILDVNNRVAAIQTARQRGLIP